jgi:hypothetical protein
MTLRHKQACAACARVQVHSVSHQRVFFRSREGTSESQGDLGRARGEISIPAHCASFSPPTP